MSGLDAWISFQTPDDDMRFVVTAWVLTRFGDPHQGVKREPGFAYVEWCNSSSLIAGSLVMGGLAS